MKRKSLMALAIALLCSVGAWAQTDVTSTYLTNADFEGEATSYAKPSGDRDIYQPTGWNISYTNGNSNDMTSLNSETTCWSNFSGKPQPTNGGSKAYWMRYRWGASENITLSQETSANLPEGTYCISAEAYSDDNTGTVTISAAGLSKTVRTDGAWAKYTLVFTLASAQKVTVSLSYTNTAADDLVAAFDNVKILDLTSEPTGIALKNDLSGTAATLSDFNVWYNDYTLEVAGTAGNEITVAADNISYTPEATGTVRFVKKDGIVYVFEGTAYKGAIHSSKADYTYARSLSGSDSSTGNILANESFETPGDVLTASKAWKLGSPWVVANFSWGGDGSGIRVQANGDTKRLVWRGSGNNAYFSQPLSLKLYKGYKVYLQQVGGGNATAKFNIGIGNAAGDYSYLSTQMTLGNGKNGTYNAVLGANENIPASGAYFTFRNTSSNTASSGSDPVTQLDWIGLVYSDDFPITGVSSASYVYGTAYAPATAKASYLAAKAEAETTIADATYDNVTGSERTALQAAIDADVDDNDAAYNTATENIQTAQDAFTGALTHYQALIDAQAAVPALAYASTAASAFKTAVATSASDADAKLAAMTNNIRAYYESHAMAEGDATTIDYTSRLTNYNNPSDTDGWTINNTTGNSNMRIMNNESYTDADGTNNHSYFDSNSWGAAFATTFTQEVALTAGDYLFTVKARGNGTTTYKVIAGDEETDISAIGNTGGVFDRGWNDYSVEFTVASDGNVTLGVQMETGSSSNWLSFGNFRLVKIDNTLADATDYSNLTSAITAAEAKTLGFAVGQYAPYNNVDALTKLAEAKAINQSANNEQSVVQGLTTYLNTAVNWHANETNVDIIYNGMFDSDVEGDWGLTGWTRTNGWGQQRKNISGDFTTAYYNQPGSLKYGDTGVYTMPLNEEEYYGLTFSYRSHEGEENSNKGVTASVLNAEDGLAAVNFTANGSTTEWKTVTAYFKTGAAGNYVLTLANSGNTWITNVSLTSYGAYLQYGDYDEDYGIDEDPEFAEIFYSDVILTRNFAGGYKWSTLVVPFDITNSELEDAFGVDVEVAEFSDEGADADHVTVNFNTMATPAVTANTPVLVKSKASVSEIELSNKLAKLSGEANAKVSGKYIDFQGIYDYTDPGDWENPFTIPAGDYFIANNALYKSEGATTIKPFRAYLKCKGALSVKLFIDDFETGIEEVQGLGLKTQSSEIYNLAGQRLNKAQKGVNIVNGKKVLIK